MDNIKLLQKRLNKIEKELEKVRGASPLSDGWQTQILAKKQRKWDELAKEKFEISLKIIDLSYEIIK
jgi:hypothetical protein